MNIVLLKSNEEPLLRILEIRNAYAIIICEGKDDAEVIKSIADKLLLNHVGRDIVITHAGGVDNVVDFLSMALGVVASKVARKVKFIMVNIDANERKDGVITDFINSLRARSIFKSIGEPRRLCEDVNTWILELELARGSLPLILSVNGLWNIFNDFESNELEDHIVYLKILRGEVKNEDLRGVRRASDIIKNVKSELPIISNSQIDLIERALGHIVCALEYMAKST